MTTLNLDIASRLTDAGRKAATALGVPVNIAVYDATAQPLHFARMDGALLGCIDIAHRKAKTAALFQVATATLGGLSRPDGPIFGIEASNGGLITFGGGLPIADADGHVIGSVGVSGGTADQDVEVARACLAAL